MYFMSIHISLDTNVICLFNSIIACRILDTRNFKMPVEIAKKKGRCIYFLAHDSPTRILHMQTF